MREGWDQVEAREDSWKGTKENFFIALLLLPASKLPYLGKQSEPRENARTRGLSPAFSRDSLYLACVASVSNRVIARKLERKQKKKKRVQSSYCAKVRADPLPRHSFFFALVPVFETNLARKRLLRRLRFTRPSRRACSQAIPSMGSPSVPSRLKLPSIFSHPQKGTSLYIKRLPTYSEKEPSREVENFDSDKEPTVFFSVDFQSFNCYFV